MDTYDLYSLSILVDLDGRVIAVNSKDADGKPIHSQDLYGKNYRESAWFRALKAQQFTTSMPFAAPGNTVATGTYIEDLHVDPDVKTAYPGDDGLTLGFSAQVYRDGKVVAYWSNRAKFSLVEDILRVTQQVMKKSGFHNSGVILLDKDGKILAEYDPASAGRAGSRRGSLRGRRRGSRSSPGTSRPRSWDLSASLGSASRGCGQIRCGAVVEV